MELKINGLIKNKSEQLTLRDVASGEVWPRRG